MGRAIAAVTVSAAESGQLDSTAPRGVYRISLARRARIVSARHLRTVGDIPPSPELVLNFRGPDSHLRSGTDFQENEIRLDAARSSIAPELSLCSSSFSSEPRLCGGIPFFSHDHVEMH
jgi:hypothetical protein